MTENEIIEKFPETGWLCPYCMTCENEQSKASVDRKDIPSHLVFHHGWDTGNFTWKRIYERLTAIGGV